MHAVLSYLIKHGHPWKRFCKHAMGSNTLTYHHCFFFYFMLVSFWVVLFLFSPEDTVSIISKKYMVGPWCTFLLEKHKPRVDSGCCGYVAFVYQQWHCRVSQTPCDNLLYRVMSVFNAVLPERLDIISKTLSADFWCFATWHESISPDFRIFLMILKSVGIVVAKFLVVSWEIEKLYVDEPCLYYCF